MSGIHRLLGSPFRFLHQGSGSPLAEFDSDSSFLSYFLVLPLVFVRLAARELASGKRLPRALFRLAFDPRLLRPALPEAEQLGGLQRLHPALRWLHRLGGLDHFPDSEQ